MKISRERNNIRSQLSILNSQLSEARSGFAFDYNYDRGSIISERNSSDKVTRTIRGLGLVAQKDAKNQMSFYLQNRHGDVTGIFDNTGNMVNSYSYDVFGQAKTSTEQIANRFKYSGEQQDSITGHYYLRARFYNPVIGRFTQEDSYRGDGLNLYAYVRNNPINFVDPSGHAGQPLYMEVDGGGSSYSRGSGVKSSSVKAGCSSMVYDYTSSSYDGAKTEILFDTPKEYDKLRQNKKELQEAKWYMKIPKGAKYVCSKISYGNRKRLAEFKVESYYEYGTDPEDTETLVYSTQGIILGEAAFQSLKFGWNKFKKPPKQVVSEPVEEIIGCFIAGTKIITKNGQKNIENIKVGELVLAKNLKTGEQNYREVIRTFVVDKYQLIVLNINGKIIETTSEHPFWTQNRGWVKAGELSEDDILEDSEGNELKIEEISIVQLENPIKVYNFEVADYHTYYVGDNGVLVHNKPSKNPEISSGVKGSGNLVDDSAVKRAFKKLSPEAKKGYEKAIEALRKGDTRGLNEHALKGNRKGQWAIDIKGMGKGRGKGRIIFTKNKDGSINIIEILTNHNY